MTHDSLATEAIRRTTQRNACWSRPLEMLASTNPNSPKRVHRPLRSKIVALSAILRKTLSLTLRLTKGYQ
jgi:hypothetical protein